MSDDTPTWGSGMRVLRSIRGLTQTELATAASVSQPTISRLENGSREASDGARVRIARALGVDPHELFPYVDAADVA